MTFAELLYFMLDMVKGSTQNALAAAGAQFGWNAEYDGDKAGAVPFRRGGRFFQQAGKEGLQMTQQAFSKARQKIKWEALQEMFQTSADGSYNEEWERWEGFRRPYVVDSGQKRVKF